MDIILPPATLRKSLMVPNKTLMGPGPSNCPQRVLDALSNPVLGHMHPECFQIMNDIKDGIKYILQTNNEATMCVSASGHGAMECALCNIIEIGDVVLCGTTGIWGQRAADMAQRYGADVRILEANFGYALILDEIKDAFEIHHPKVFFMAQGDSSTGILQNNIKEIGLICRKYNCLFIVDTVASMGGVEFYMDDWLVDIAYTGSQKVLGAPPGITPISFNQRALNRIKMRKTKCPVYYFDVELIGKYWGCFGPERIYHHTISSTLLYGLREALAIFAQQGLKSIINRHMECSYRLQKGIENLGLELFVPEPSHRLATVNTVKVPQGVDWIKVSQYAMSKYNLEISGGLGATAGKVFRIGLMGENGTIERVELVLNVLREAIQNTSIISLNEKSKF